MSTCTICRNKVGGFAKRAHAPSADVSKCVEAGYAITLPVCENCVRKVLKGESLPYQDARKNSEKSPELASSSDVLLIDRINPGRYMQIAGWILVALHILVTLLAKWLASTFEIYKNLPQGDGSLPLLGIIFIVLGACFRRVINQNFTILKLLREQKASADTESN